MQKFNTYERRLFFALKARIASSKVIMGSCLEAKSKPGFLDEESFKAVEGILESTKAELKDLTMAINVLRFRIPMKTIYEEQTGINYCPHCRNPIPVRYLKFTRPHCFICGQALASQAKHGGVLV